MSDKPDVTNSLSGSGGRPGDLPPGVRRRYLAERRLDGSVAYFTDATVMIASFRDTGRRLVAARSDPATIRDLLAVAEHRGWRTIEARGAAGFRREAWAQGQILGLEVLGYRPTERDREAILRRQSRDDGRAPQRATQARSPLDLSEPRARLRVVETVVRDRVADRDAQARILAAARARAAELQQRRDRERELPRGR